MSSLQATTDHFDRRVHSPAPLPGFVLPDQSTWLPWAEDSFPILCADSGMSEVKRDKLVRDNPWNIVHVRVGVRMDSQVLFG